MCVWRIPLHDTSVLAAPPLTARPSLFSTAPLNITHGEAYRLLSNHQPSRLPCWSKLSGEAITNRWGSKFGVRLIHPRNTPLFLLKHCLCSYATPSTKKTQNAPHHRSPREVTSQPSCKQKYTLCLSMKRVANTSSTGPVVRAAKKVSTRGSRLVVAAGGGAATSPRNNSSSCSVDPKTSHHLQEQADVCGKPRGNITHDRPYGGAPVEKGPPPAISPVRRSQRINSTTSTSQSATPRQRQSRRVSSRTLAASPTEDTARISIVSKGHTKRPPPAGDNLGDSEVGDGEKEVWATLMGKREQEQEQQLHQHEEREAHREDWLNVRMVSLIRV